MIEGSKLAEAEVGAVAEGDRAADGLGELEAKAEARRMAGDGATAATLAAVGMKTTCPGLVGGDRVDGDRLGAEDEATEPAQLSLGGVDELTAALLGATGRDEGGQAFPVGRGLQW